MARNRRNEKVVRIGFTKRRNTPIVKLINQYEDKRGGKVVDSRKEIQWRFEALDWEHQQRILQAFLQSGKGDRIWACSWLRSLWDPSFEPKIKELWETYHEDACKWVVIRHLPKEYVVQHMQEFNGPRDYYYICLRLAADKDYRIDADRLSIADYLAVLFHSGRDLDGINTQTILFQIVRENCLRRLRTYDFDKSFDFHHPADLLCPFDLRDIGRARYYLRESGIQYDIPFLDYNNKVREDILASEEYRQLKAHADPPYLPDRWMYDIMRKYAYLALPDAYKQKSDPSPYDMVKPMEEYRFYSFHDDGDSPLQEQTEDIPF